jgi:hypothetical protein
MYHVFINLVTPKVGAKHEPLFNKPASEHERRRQSLITLAPAIPLASLTVIAAKIKEEIGRDVKWLQVTSNDVMAFSIMPLSIMPLSIMTLSIMTFSITTLTIITLTITTLTIMRLTIMTFTIMTLTIITLTMMPLSIMTLYTLSIITALAYKQPSS